MRQKQFEKTGGSNARAAVQTDGRYKPSWEGEGMTDQANQDGLDDSVTLTVTLVEECVALTITRDGQADITVFLSTKDAQRVSHALRDTAAIANLRLHLEAIGAAKRKNVTRH